MIEIRFAQPGEIEAQKNIWKQCFGDPDNYIDLYYSRKYKMDETVLLIAEEEIAAMLTILPAKVVSPENTSIDTAILYAIATHPKYQKKGYASKLINYTTEYLYSQNKPFSLLVPATKQLFEFYRKQSYTDAFYTRQIQLSNKQVFSKDLMENYNCKLHPTTPQQYNLIRNIRLKDRLFVSYPDEVIAYQKMISQESGADIYSIEINDIPCCAAIERYSSEKVMIKELLCPDIYLDIIMKQINQLFPAKNYILRTPAFSGQQYESIVKPFAMLKKYSDISLDITPEALGYLGLAFD